MSLVTDMSCKDGLLIHSSAVVTGHEFTDLFGRKRRQLRVGLEGFKVDLTFFTRLFRQPVETYTIWTYSIRLTDLDFAPACRDLHYSDVHHSNACL